MSPETSAALDAVIAAIEALGGMDPRDRKRAETVDTMATTDAHKPKPGRWYVGGNGRDVLQFDERKDCGQLIATVASYVQSEGHTSIGPETARLISAAPDLLEAVRKCAAQFREYERLHLEKCTLDGNEKAARNAAMAELCEAALSKATGEQQ